MNTGYSVPPFDLIDHISKVILNSGSYEQLSNCGIGSARPYQTIQAGKLACGHLRLLGHHVNIKGPVNTSLRELFTIDVESLIRCKSFDIFDNLRFGRFGA